MVIFVIQDEAQRPKALSKQWKMLKRLLSHLLTLAKHVSITGPTPGLSALIHEGDLVSP
jgi:hypothetical protein